MALCLLMEGCDRSVMSSCLVLGAFSGGFGSLVDSLLGATIQQTKYSTKKRMIVGGHKDNSAKVISGYDILSNNQVNFLSSLLTAVVVGWLA
ncbi:hypothetical protein AX16_006157 [Volvariella volvacea WC 439]|nr:hypothetical protein AX16_006157 [Volvariella volvacea WC 439]